MDTPDIIPYEYVTHSLSFDPRKSSFTTFLETILDPLVVEGLVDQYQLGVTKSGDVVFFQIDKEGRCRTGKIVKYDPVTGNRIKDGSSPCPITWIHALMKRKGLLPEEWELSQCLFGEHLLPKYPDRAVALVESEQTAIICAGFLSEYIWLATGGKTILGDKLDVLSGRKVVAYPDIDAYDYWFERLSAYPNISVSNCLQQLAGGNPSSSPMDLADFILEGPQQGTKKNMTFQQIKRYISPEYHSEAEALINDLGLELLGVDYVPEDKETSSHSAE